MKNIFFMIFVLFGLGVFTVSQIDLADISDLVSGQVQEPKKTHSVYVKEYYHDLDSDSYVELGFATQVFVDKKIFKELTQDENILSSALEINTSNHDITRLCETLGIVVVNRQFVSGYEMIFGYSKKIKSKAINGSNLQIAWNSKKIVIGSPIILGEI